MAKKAKIETDKTFDMKPDEQVLTTEARLARLEGHREQSIVVTNNLITYANTIEQWRKMDFVPKTEESVEENETPVEETNED